LGLAAALCATTLEQLSMSSMVGQSTSIVRAHITGSFVVRRGSSLYTSYGLDILETLKASQVPPAEVAVPGGALDGVRQTVAGAPKLEAGQEYVLFLWTSPTGLTQVIGLTQGIFRVVKNAGGEATVVRSATTETMLNAGGQPVQDQTLSLSLEALRQLVLGGGR